VRAAFTSDLDQLRLQVEVMALKVDAALKRSNQVLMSGDDRLASEVLRGDDDIDAMLVSLTEKCYDILGRQNPVASDLRFIVSVLRTISDLERVGDLCLRIVKLAPDQARIASNDETFGILRAMASEAEVLFNTAVRAWATQDLRLAVSLEKRDDAMDAYNERLAEAILRLSGGDAVPVAIATVLAGRALERIADHSVMIGERLRYMLTGDVASLSKEIGP
jgi:phosphate transport system protein